jgi:hypothetical protein
MVRAFHEATQERYRGAYGVCGIDLVTVEFEQSLWYPEVVSNSLQAEECISGRINGI